MIEESQLLDSQIQCIKSMPMFLKLKAKNMLEQAHSTYRVKPLILANKNFNYIYGRMLKID